ncbi:TonB family protein [Psychromonas sp.]|nr:TonB family protein [Psychromonas sp.]
MLRMLFALPMALLVSYALMGIMAWMVDLNTRPDREKAEALQFDIFMQEKEQSSERLTRKLPEPPLLKPETPKTPPSQPSAPQPMSNPTFDSLPEIDMDLAVTGMSIAVPANNISEINHSTTKLSTAVAGVGESQQVMPLHRIEPVYPRRALQRKIEGYVVLTFDIDKRGQPTNINVIDEAPPRIFNREALKALKNWKYQPKVVNGQAQEQTNQKIKLEFKLR